MNIPDDVRQAILICCSWAELYGHKVEEDAAYAVMEWLDAQPAAPTERWEPVTDMEWQGAPVSVGVDRGVLGIWTYGQPPVDVPLPADLRLCRRVETISYLREGE